MFQVRINVKIVTLLNRHAESFAINRSRGIQSQAFNRLVITTPAKKLFATFIINLSCTEVLKWQVSLPSLMEVYQ